MVTFELAKKLKDAGWPQPNFTPEEGCYVDGRRLEGVYVYEDEENWDEHYETACYSPTLSELIAGSGDGFLTLCRVKHSGGVLWQAWGSGAEDDFRVDGATPEEAVANLWLSLQGEKK